jgi:hypothetical protein
MMQLMQDPQKAEAGLRESQQLSIARSILTSVLAFSRKEGVDLLELGRVCHGLYGRGALTAYLADKDGFEAGRISTVREYLAIGVKANGCQLHVLDKVLADSIACPKGTVGERIVYHTIDRLSGEGGERGLMETYDPALTVCLATQWHKDAKQNDVTTTVVALNPDFLSLDVKVLDGQVDREKL